MSCPNLLACRNARTCVFTFKNPSKKHVLWYICKTLFDFSCNPCYIEEAENDRKEIFYSVFYLHDSFYLYFCPEMGNSLNLLIEITQSDW